MQLGCVDTANGYGICKKNVAFITKYPLDISACSKLPFLLYVYIYIYMYTDTAHLRQCACFPVETIHPLKHKQPLKLFIQFRDQRTENKSEY